MIKGASVALGFTRIAAEAGFSLDLELRSDSSAGLGMVNRRGLGKVRHVEVVFLWLQEKVERGEVMVKKVATDGNWGDLGAKPP